MHILVVANRTSLLQALRGIRLLSDVSMVFGNGDMQSPLRFGISSDPLLEQFRSQCTALCPESDASVLIESLCPRLSRKFAGWQAINNLLTDSCRFGDPFDGVESTVKGHREDGILAADFIRTLPLPDRPTGLCCLRSLFQLLQGICQPDFEGWDFGSRRITTDELSNRCRKIFVA